MAAKAAAEGAHRDDAVHEPRELSARERDLAAKYIKLIQGERRPSVPYSNVSKYLIIFFYLLVLLLKKSGIVRI